MANEKNLKPFKPGQSGNPAGRPKGSKNIKTILKKLLASQDIKGEWANPVAKKLIQKAFNDNDLQALIEIISRIEGKPKQSAKCLKRIDPHIKF
jgi:hypothetical protein